MRRNARADRRLSSALNRRSREEIEETAREVLERDRRALYARQAKTAEAEAEILREAAENGDERLAARLAPRIAQAQTDAAFAASALAFVQTVPASKPGGFSVSGVITAEEGQPPDAYRVVFLSSGGKVLEDMPELIAEPDGSVYAALSATDLEQLRAAAGEDTSIRFGLKAGARVIAETRRPLVLGPGRLLQFCLSAPPKPSLGDKSARLHQRLCASVPRRGGAS